MNNYEYIIGGKISFSLLKESLYLTEHPEVSVTLTPSCGRLLDFMLSEKGCVLSREAIFDKLWVQYGSTPSNSSLNTYISLVRKAFLKLGEEREVVITIPKAGFVFNPEIEVKMVSCDINIDEEVATADLLPSVDNSIGYVDIHEKLNNEEVNQVTSKSSDINLLGGQKITPKKKRGILNLFYLGLFSVVVMCSVFLLGSAPESSKALSTKKIGHVGGCDVFFLPLHGNDLVSIKKESVEYIINKTGFTCTNHGVFYLYADKRYMAGQIGKTFVSYCNAQNKNSKSCADFIGVDIEPQRELLQKTLQP